VSANGEIARAAPFSTTLRGKPTAAEGCLSTRHSIGIGTEWVVSMAGAISDAQFRGAEESCEKRRVEPEAAGPTLRTALPGTGQRAFYNPDDLTVFGYEDGIVESASVEKPSLIWHN
jgi:hypothetical protein